MNERGVYSVSKLIICCTIQLRLIVFTFVVCWLFAFITVLETVIQIRQTLWHKWTNTLDVLKITTVNRFVYCFRRHHRCCDMPFSSWIDPRKAESKAEPRELTKDNSLELNMNSTSPKSSLAKIGLHPKPKPFRILILGTSGVGKTGNYFSLIHICLSISTKLINRCFFFIGKKLNRMNETLKIQNGSILIQSFILVYFFPTHT